MTIEAAKPGQDSHSIIPNSNGNKEEQIFDIVFNQDEVTWQSILMDLVKSEQMDPWDIDVSILAKKYIDRIKKLKEKADLRISGKVVLAAAILLKIKSTRLLKEDIAQFDNLLSGEDVESLYDENLQGGDNLIDRSKYKELRLVPKTPQPRKRKVSIYDLLEALEKALDIEKKRRLRIPPAVKMEIPEKKIDLSELMGKLYLKVLGWFKKDEQKDIFFSELVPDKSRLGKIYTFIPLLHLTNQRKIDLDQEREFADFKVKVIKDNIDKEIAKELEEY